MSAYQCATGTLWVSATLVLSLWVATATAVPPVMAFPAPETPPPPTPPEYVDAFIGYERMPALDTQGERWYRLSALKRSGEHVSLYQSSVVCRNGLLWFSASDGGSFRYNGGVFRQGTREVATLAFDTCDDCRVTPRLKRPRTLAFSQPDADTLMLGDVIHDRRIDPDSRVCPPKAGTVSRAP